MAFFDSYDEEEEKKQQNNTLTQEKSILEGSDSSKQGTTGGTGFTNFQDYVDVNQGSQGIDNTIDMIKDNYGVESKDYSDFSSQAQGIDQVDYDEAFFSDILNDTTGFASSDDNIAKWNESQKVGRYEGPDRANDLTGFDDNQKGIDKLSSLTDAWNKDTNRQSILQDSVKDNSYGRGQSTLDSFLLGASDQGKGFEREIQNTYQSNLDNWNKAQDTVNQAISDEKQDVSNIRNRVGSVKNSLDARFDAEIGKAKQMAGSKNQQLQSDWNSGKLVGQAAEQAGIDNEFLDWYKSQGNDARGLFDVNTSQNHWLDSADTNTLDAISALTGNTYDNTRLPAGEMFRVKDNALSTAQAGYQAFLDEQARIAAEQAAAEEAARLEAERIAAEEAARQERLRIEREQGSKGGGEEGYSNPAPEEDRELVNLKEAAETIVRDAPKNALDTLLDSLKPKPIRTPKFKRPW